MRNRSAPSSTVVPVLVYDNVQLAVDWLCQNFGFVERLRFTDRDGHVSHAQLTFAEGAFMLGRQGGEFRSPRPDEVSQYVLVRVEKVDEHFERVRESSAKIVRPLSDMPFGERQYTVKDPWGHQWTFSQPVADVAPEAWGASQPTKA